MYDELQHTVSIFRFADFYLLEAMTAGLTMAKSANKSLEFKHSTVKFETDLMSYKRSFCEKFAERVMLYLWYAALGEAEYANNWAEIKIESGGNFGESEPNAENLQAVLDVFEADGWPSGYGGEAWAEIVRTMMRYNSGEWSAEMFLDHAADLEHNGGCAFNKGGSAYHGFSSDGYNKLRWLLDYKFKSDILNDRLPFDLSVTKTTGKMLIRYNNTTRQIENAQAFHVLDEDVESKVVDWTGYSVDVVYNDPRSEFCDHCEENCHETTWVEATKQSVCNDCLSHNFSPCENCGDYQPDEDAINHNGDYYCQSCFEDNFTYCEFCEDYAPNDDIYSTEDTNKAVCYDCLSEVHEVAGLYYEEEENIPEENTEENTQNTPEENTEPSERMEKVNVKWDGGGWTRMAKIYDIGGGLWIVNGKDVWKKGKNEDHYFVHHNKTGYNILSGKTKTKQEAINAGKAMLNHLDFSSIRTTGDWDKVPQKVKDQILESVREVLK